MQELNEIRVTWQLAVVICTLAFLPIAAVALVSVILEPGQPGQRGVEIVCTAVIAVGLLICLMAIRSRLSSVVAAEERAFIVKKIVWGVLVIAVAAALTAVSCFFGTFSMLGSKWYMVPTGLYVIGLVLIGRAMVPTES